MTLCNERSPLLGVTILVCAACDEDAEAWRISVLRTGGRMRRAACEKSYWRHLQVYTPSAVVKVGNAKNWKDGPQ
jgi:hypothetical protein